MGQSPTQKLLGRSGPIIRTKGIGQDKAITLSHAAILACSPAVFAVAPFCGEESNPNVLTQGGPNPISATKSSRSSKKQAMLSRNLLLTKCLPEGTLSGLPKSALLYGVSAHWADHELEVRMLGDACKLESRKLWADSKPSPGSPRYLKAKQNVPGECGAWQASLRSNHRS